MSVITNGLLLWFDGIDNTGTGEHSITTTTWKDLSGNGNDGVIAYPSWRTQCLAFDGVKNWVDCGAQNPSYATLEVVVQFNSIGSEEAEYNSVAGNWQTGGFGIQQKNAKNSANFNGNGTWYHAYGSNCKIQEKIHLTTTYDGSNLKLYENGTLVSTVNVSGSIKAPAEDTVFSIGSNPLGGEIGITPLNGYVFAVRLYNRALTSSEVFENYEYDLERFKTLENDKFSINASTLIGFADEARRISGVTKNLTTIQMLEIFAKAHTEYDFNVKSVNHRGYNLSAPENTIPAYVLSKKNGFNYVECDVSFTSDGVAVLLHDSTIDRTSNGSGNVSELTYEELLTYDFGSWFSSDYTGTVIPTFDEFIKFCKRVSLHPYIELKSNGGYTQEQITNVVNIVKKVGMKGKVTYISFNSDFLEYVKIADPSARLGYLSSTATESVITTALNLKTETNEVFVDIKYSAITDGFVELCIENDLPLEVWTVNTESDIKSMNGYVSGVTSDNLIAGKILYEKYMNTLNSALIDIDMTNNGVNIGTGGSTYDATTTKATFSNGKVKFSGNGCLTVPTDFMAMSATNKWTIAFTIDSYELGSQTYSRIARGVKDVPSLYYNTNYSGFQHKLVSKASAVQTDTNQGVSGTSWYDTDFYEVNSVGGLSFSPFEEKTTFAFRNDGGVVSFWVNGEKKCEALAEKYTSEYWASTFSIGNNDPSSSYNMASLECSMLKIWNKALYDNEMTLLK